MKLYLQLVLVCLFFLGAPALARQPVPVDLRTEQARAATVEALARDAAERKQEAHTVARARGWAVRGITPAGRVFELMALDEHGHPLYYSTMNATAAVSTAANLVRDTSPYDVLGSNLIVGVWDGGAVRTNHQEFVSPNRVFVKDGSAYLNHATHVGGTLGARGVVAAAMGMAPAVVVHSYDWTSDQSEMAAEAATDFNQTNRIYISNHSYTYLAGWEQGNYSGYDGWHWFGYDLAEREARAFGQYDNYARAWDGICRQAPFYLPFVVAANDRQDGTPSSGGTFRFNGVNYTFNPSVHPYADNHKQGGYNTIKYMGVAKNVMTVGAVNDAISGGVRNPAVAAMNDFSCWGPTDDGRIKPDIVANGVVVYSSTADGTNTYALFTGTSMAAPNAGGSALLLIEYYRKLFPAQDMRAATLKGLIIHTADDLGTAGPDYIFGWGLMNTKAAADHILNHHEQPGAFFMIEDTLTAANPTKSYEFLWDGESAIRATLSWTDPEGTAQAGLNSTNRNLVNDLDLRVIGPDGTTNFPYILNRASPTNAATVGDNQVDNVEQVFISDPGEMGLYTLRVSHKDSLSGGPQAFSVLLSGTTESLEPKLKDLVWDGISSPQYTNIPFAATITAKDNFGDVADFFTGPVELCGYVSATGTVGLSDWQWGAPLTTYFEDARTQVIYLQSELGGAMKIYSLGLNVQTIPPLTLTAWTIRMKHTKFSTFSTAEFDGPDSGWTTVYQYNETIGSTGWVFFAFDTPFDYNGTENLMVDFCFNNSTWASDGITYQTPITNRLVYGVSDSNHGDPLTWSGSSPLDASTPALSNLIPNIRLKVERVVEVLPAEADGFTNGVWTGSITVKRVVTNLYIRAEAAGNVKGDSNKFNVQAQSSTSRILTVISTYGTPWPAGITLTNVSSTVNAVMAGSPASGGNGIQYECIGASVSGNNFTPVTPTHLTLTITNDTTIAWQWRTNYWISPSAGPNGALNVAPGWQASGMTTTITATADAYYHFTNWTGDVSGGQEIQNPLNLLVNAPKTIQANFRMNMTTSAPIAVPYLWLAGYDITGDFEGQVLEDTDEDGALNWMEFVMDTDPTNRLSVLTLDPHRSGGGSYLLGWYASTGRVYALYMGTNQPGVITNELFTEWRPGLTGTATYTDAVHSAKQRIYYRIKVALPEE